MLVDAFPDGMAYVELAAVTELFIDRTRRARAGFRLTSANAETVQRICRRLDGLPLALEFVARSVRCRSGR